MLLCHGFLLALLLFAPAMAQEAAPQAIPETIEAFGTHSLAGIWKIDFPGGAPISVPFVVRGTIMGYQAFCRMGEAKDSLTVSCLPWNGEGTATLDDKNLHLAWGEWALRFVVDAPILTGTAFTGSYKLKLLGDSHEAPAPATGRKLAPLADAPDTPGQGPFVLARLKEIAAGAAPLGDIARKDFGGMFGGAPANTVTTLQGLGAPLQAIYLGASVPPEIPPPAPGTRPDDRNNARFTFYNTGFSAYDVEFAGGAQLLCGVHADKDGKVNLLCV